MSDQSLSSDALEEILPTLNVAWSAIPGQGLVRVFETSGFAEGLALVNRIAAAAEKAGRYPEVTLRGDQVEVTCSTPEMGITQHDVELAQAIDGIDL